MEYLRRVAVLWRIRWGPCGDVRVKQLKARQLLSPTWWGPWKLGSANLVLDQGRWQR